MPAPSLGTRLLEAFGAIRRLANPLSGQSAMGAGYVIPVEDVLPPDALAVGFALGEPVLAHLDAKQQVRFNRLFALQASRPLSDEAQQAAFERLYAEVTGAYEMEASRITTQYEQLQAGHYRSRNGNLPAVGALIPIPVEVTGQLMQDAAEALTLELKIQGVLDAEDREALLLGIARKTLRTRYELDAGLIELAS